MKQADHNGSRDANALCRALVSVRSVPECRRLLEDLCTPAEIRALADRWKVARMLRRGVPYRKIYEKTGVSTATVARVARALSQGAGGYKLILDRCEEPTDA